MSTKNNQIRCSINNTTEYTTKTVDSIEIIEVVGDFTYALATVNGHSYIIFKHNSFQHFWFTSEETSEALKI